MSFAQIVPGFINQLQPPVLPVSVVKTEFVTVIKSELPESEIGVNDILDSSDKEIISDTKDSDIVLHRLCEASIKSETTPTVKTEHLESVETQVDVKIENYSFIKTENIIQTNKIEDSSAGNGSWSTGQLVVEVQGMVILSVQFFIGN